jgi:hypothetical protein
MYALILFNVPFAPVEDFVVFMAYHFLQTLIVLAGVQFFSKLGGSFFGMAALAFIAVGLIVNAVVQVGIKVDLEKYVGVGSKYVMRNSRLQCG